MGSSSKQSRHTMRMSATPSLSHGESQFLREEPFDITGPIHPQSASSRSPASLVDDRRHRPISSSVEPQEDYARSPSSLRRSRLQRKQSLMETTQSHQAASSTPAREEQEPQVLWRT